MKVNIDIKNNGVKIPEELINAADGDELIARLFYNRGYKDPHTVKQMLHDQLYVPTDIWEFQNMKDAVDIIRNAIGNKEKIAVYGDYDVDGVTSTALLVQCLGFLTPNVLYHVPDRFTEGYGMNEGVIQRLHEKGVSLVITCDCGVSNVNEVTLAKELEMKVIVTDHHSIPDVLPPADVILNPKLLKEGHKARNLSGCAMAYFLSKALLKSFDMEEKSQLFMDLVAMSLIADVVSLNGENRYLLKNGLPILFNTKRTGLKSLFNIIQKNSKLQTEEDVAFQIAPRINAAGRMDSARLPVEMLLSRQAKIADDMAGRINSLNEERKRVQEQIIKEAQEIVENYKKMKSVLVLYSEFWHHGIIGIAAGKICETYRKPAILLSLKEDGQTIVGSARSTDDVNIYELLKETSGKLLKYGGHSKAAGLSLKKEDIKAFTDEIEDMAERLIYTDNSMEIVVDSELSFENIDEDFYERLKKAGPYGEGFEAPLFLTRSVSILNDRITPKNHHIMVVSDINDVRLAAVKWFGGSDSFKGKVCDIVYKVGLNSYKNNTTLQLTIEHIVETDGKIRRAFEGVIEDCRNLDVMEAAKVHENSIVFYEGISQRCPVDGTRTRMQLKKADNLVFLSVPVNSNVFREAVFMVNPKRVILNFSILSDYTFKGFLTLLFGVLKESTSTGEGCLEMYELSMLLGVEEEIVRTALKYLKAAGKIDYIYEPDDIMVTVWRKNAAPSLDISVCEKKLTNALLEKNAYQSFIKNLECHMFKEYLKV
ncbi:single-stranded-DNA-specific exonuclease RecJ [Pseudobacteroides cellulosolvens]|uniref:Single-stranded-DNA-specific exonuclease RecJ n=1 Tax=Pseudobacteroides cellulosolvens ATCC 35603 = DSM 2933 TaxID=398512 RepID=A0A0L6JLD6_9FIRM|nr:single-stranded-DNA-specific exonuclease RecJ [Pseudobacteroides cellulosolvens]KNY26636.1 single-stranded-DNA-specific exonuclease RecJ [Pseudobacteroides cellulosolvens ATCC 35603 = DSM 2933]